MDITAKQFHSLLVELKKVREHLEQLHQKWHEQVTAENATQQRQEDQRNVQPIWIEPILTKYKQPEADRKAETKKQSSIQNSMRWATWFTFGATLLAFGAAAYYAYWARRTYFEIANQTPKIAESADAALISANASKESADTTREQFELFKKQVIAIVSFSFADATEPRQKTEIALHFNNDGHVVSNPTKVKVEILRTNFGGTTTISGPEHYSFTVPPLKPPHGEIPDTFTWKHKLGYPLAQNFRDDETVRIIGTIFGTDGFGHQLLTPFCVSYLPYAHIELEHESEGIQAVGDSFLDCKTFTSEVARVRKFGVIE